MDKQQILLACKAGISKWQTAFNNQSSKQCAEQYTLDCIMNARPFGAFDGQQAIQDFWQDLMDKGFKEVQYTNVVWTAEGDNGFILTADWTMNKAFGVIHREHWVVDTKTHVQAVAKLIHDDFEVLGER